MACRSRGQQYSGTPTHTAKYDEYDKRLNNPLSVPHFGVMVYLFFLTLLARAGAKKTPTRGNVSIDTAYLMVGFIVGQMTWANQMMKMVKPTHSSTHSVTSTQSQKRDFNLIIVLNQESAELVTPVSCT